MIFIHLKEGHNGQIPIPFWLQFQEKLFQFIGSCCIVVKLKDNERVIEKKEKKKKKQKRKSGTIHTDFFFFCENIKSLSKIFKKC